MKRIGLVGARGHVGAELLRLVDAHPAIELAFACSRSRAGDPHGTRGLRYEDLAPADIARREVDAVVLALPNGASEPYVSALAQVDPARVIVDLSADHRFDDWHYGLPELTRGQYTGQRRIANPGCYATAMQLAIAPLRDELAGPPACFGVSGWSGAGTTPSDRNDPAKLRDNLMPYALADHLHEREVTRRLGLPVEFMPHVGPHFRGIMLTVNLWLQHATTRDAVAARYREHYRGEPLVRVLDEAPWVSAIAGCHHAEVGGFTVAPGGRRVVIVATLDNLLKGAATQAMQNLNLALGLDELAGIPVPVASDADAPLESR